MERGCNRGGGIYCHSAAAFVSNCVVIGNTTSPYLAGTLGGGVYQGTLVNCLLENNSAQSGAGACAATLNDCVLTGNSTLYQGQGGGACNGTLNNCLLEGNSAEYGGGAFYATLNSCSLSNNAASLAGGGAYAGVLGDCLIVSNTAPYGGGTYLGTLYNCDVIGNSATTGSGGEEDGVLENCIVYYNNGGNYGSDYQPTNLNYCCTTPLPANSVGDIMNDPAFVNQTGGNYHLKSNSPCINAGNNAYVTNATDLDGNPRIAYGTVDLGAYESPYNTTNVHYVSLTSTNPETPFNGWSIAATNIQDAINAARTGDSILVTNGLYFGTTQHVTVPVFGVVQSRILIPGGLTVSSVNGPGVTAIQGGASVSCAVLESNAILNGFTLTNGVGTPNAFGGSLGGGAYCLSSNALISDCVICSNSAYAGAGVYSGTLTNCILSNNLATSFFGPGGIRYSGGGAYGSQLDACFLIDNIALQGGGTFNCILTNCVLFGNIATAGAALGAGGGAFGGVLNDCLVISNLAAAACSNVMNNCLIIYNQTGADSPSVAFGSTLTNCTICYNTVPADSDLDPVVTACVLRNCILYYDLSPQFLAYGTTDILNCCVAETSYYNYYYNNPNFHNLTNAPLFVNPSAGNFQLQSNSPCINSGNNAFVSAATDLDGNPRIAGGTVDIGAYEYQNPASIISYAWLQQYGLPTDGSVDDADLDGAAFNVYQDWIAGLNPTNPASVLAMSAPPATNNTSGITVTWQSVSGIIYNLQRSTNLPVFTTINTNIFGLAGTTSYNDATATNNGPYFYRVGVP
jgi:hypothetical protein